MCYWNLLAFSEWKLLLHQFFIYFFQCIHLCCTPLAVLSWTWITLKHFQQWLSFHCSTGFNQCLGKWPLEFYPAAFWAFSCFSCCLCLSFLDWCELPLTPHTIIFRSHTDRPCGSPFISTLKHCECVFEVIVFICMCVLFGCVRFSVLCTADVWILTPSSLRFI